MATSASSTNQGDELCGRETFANIVDRIPLVTLHPFLRMSQASAAKALGISPTVLKKLCWHYGLLHKPLPQVAGMDRVVDHREVQDNPSKQCSFATPSSFNSAMNGLSEHENGSIEMATKRDHGAHSFKDYSIPASIDGARGSTSETFPTPYPSSTPSNFLSYPDPVCQAETANAGTVPRTMSAGAMAGGGELGFQPHEAITAGSRTSMGDVDAMSNVANAPVPSTPPLSAPQSLFIPCVVIPPLRSCFPKAFYCDGSAEAKEYALNFGRRKHKPTEPQPQQLELEEAWLNEGPSLASAHEEFGSSIGTVPRRMGTLNGDDERFGTLLASGTSEDLPVLDWLMLRDTERSTTATFN